MTTKFPAFRSQLVFENRQEEQLPASENKLIIEHPFNYAVRKIAFVFLLSYIYIFLFFYFLHLKGVKGSPAKSSSIFQKDDMAPCKIL